MTADELKKNISDELRTPQCVSFNIATFIVLPWPL